MGGEVGERHGKEESKNHKNNSVGDIWMLREVEKDRGVYRTWKNKDNKKMGDAEVRR